MRRLLLPVVLVVLSLFLVAIPAGADPQAETFDLECDGDVPDGAITANSGLGLWTPGFAVDGPGVYIPYQLEFAATFYPDGGDPFVVGPDVFVRRAPMNTKSHLHGVCTFEGEQQLVDDPDFGTGLLVFTAEAHVFWTGR